MAKVIPLFRDKTKTSSKDTKDLISLGEEIIEGICDIFEETLQDIAKKNEENEKRLTLERQQANQDVKRKYRIHKKGKT